MNELCVPLPSIADNQVAEVIVSIEGKEKKYNFRVESFRWLSKNDAAIDDSTDLHLAQEKIQKLKQSIEGYDDDWELIQIYTPQPGAEFIQVLFRKK